MREIFLDDDAVAVPVRHKQVVSLPREGGASQRKVFRQDEALPVLNSQSDCTVEHLRRTYFRAREIGPHVLLPYDHRPPGPIG